MWIPIPPFYIPDSIAPDFLSGLIGRAQTAMGGTVLAGSGLIGLAMIPPRIANKNLKLLAQITGAGMFVYGVVQVAKAVSPIPPIIPKPPKPGERYEMYVAHPTGDDKVFCSHWPIVREFPFETIVTNPVNEDRQVYIGMTLHEIDGDYHDYPAQPVLIRGNATKSVIWKGEIGCFGVERWEVRFSTWDKPPSPEATRIGDTGWFPFTTRL